MKRLIVSSTDSTPQLPAGKPRGGCAAIWLQSAFEKLLVGSALPTRSLYWRSSSTASRSAFLARAPAVTKSVKAFSQVACAAADGCDSGNGNVLPAALVTSGRKSIPSTVSLVSLLLTPQRVALIAAFASRIDTVAPPPMLLSTTTCAVSPASALMERLVGTPSGPRVMSRVRLRRGSNSKLTFLPPPARPDLAGPCVGRGDS